MTRNKAAADESDAKLNSILAQLTNINNRLDKVDLLNEQLNNIEESMKTMAADNTTIKQTLANNQSAIANLQSNQNRIDQYNRSWSVRIMQLQLSPDEESNPFHLVDTVYNKVFLPILKGAWDQKLIKTIPSCEQLLERAHVLPAAKPGSIKPIICRFYNRDYRAICFRLKKDYAAREATGSAQSGGGASGGVSGGAKAYRYAFPFYEDLTTTTFKKLKEIQADSRVESCWSVNGQLRYRLVGSELVKRVKQTTDSTETILK
jgi:hypothetical protein